MTVNYIRVGKDDLVEDESVQKRAAARHAERQARHKYCRHCGCHLMSDPEYRLGIHVRCVYDAETRAQAFTIPRPRYGSR